MANPQPDIFIGWSKELWRALIAIRIPGVSRQIFDAIALLTYGANPRIKEAQISNKQIMELTGLNKVSVSKGLKQLFVMNLVTKDGNYRPPIIRINKDYESWVELKKKLPKMVTPRTDAGLQRERKNQLPKMVTKVTKDGNKKQITPIISKRREIAGEIYNFYINEISPSDKTRNRAVKNIEYHLKKHLSDDLKLSIKNYKMKALKREPEYRKNPANFFGHREKDQYFIDYLKGNFEPSGNEYNGPRNIVTTANNMGEEING